MEVPSVFFILSEKYKRLKLFSGSKVQAIILKNCCSIEKHDNNLLLVEGINWHVIAFSKASTS